MIETQTDSSISEIFNSQSNIKNLVIESPLEASELSSTVLQNQALELLSDKNIAITG